MGRRDDARRARRGWRDTAIVALAIAVCALAAVAPGASRLTDSAIDVLLLSIDAPVSGRVVVLDIDDASLAARGPWPWPRSLLAELVAKASDAKPAAIALDMLLLERRGGCENPPPASEGGAPVHSAPRGGTGHDLCRPDPDDDGLRQVLSTSPIVLGALLDGRPTEEPSFVAPMVVTQPQPRLRPWQAAGVRMPPDSLVELAAGTGIASLAPGADGVVRTVPLLVAAGASVLPGLAAETIRVAEQASAVIVSATPSRLRLGGRTVDMTRTADLRFIPSAPGEQALRTMAATDVLSGAAPTQRLTGRIVLIGGSAVELGALRETSAGPLVPSVQIHADAIETMLAGNVPLRPDQALLVEFAALIAMSGLTAWIGLNASPQAAFAATAALAAMWLGVVAIAFAGYRLLIDPALPVAGAALGGGSMIIVGFVRARHAARHLRQRFEQHLAPAVVQRVVDNIDAMKLPSEHRIVTALFTDIEGFTAMTERLPPEALIDVLDAYFADVSAIVVRHGGMIDKIVGDAVHALFNAPFDLDDHPAKALDCAFEIVAFTEAFRARPEIAPRALGRTRIGIETGPVVLGDVGRGSKLDYTAHGSAVNTAARLEALNARFGTAICVGPECRELASRYNFRSLGATEIRGRGSLEVFEPLAGSASSVRS